MNKIEKLKKKYNLVELLGVSRQAVNEWKYLPPLRAMEIEYLTDGEFKAVELINPKSVKEWG